MDKKLSNATIAWIIMLVTVVVLVFTAPQIGLTWDEPAYMSAAESYMAWFKELFTNPSFALSEVGIDRYWFANHEHPPFDKLWAGLVWSVARFGFDDLLAHRLGNMLLVGALVGMLYYFLAENYGVRVGLLAVAILMTMPRFFFHAHLAALDVPAAVLIFAVVFFFWRGKDKTGWRPTVILGVVWGLAMATKVNAAFVMPTLLIWIVLFQREWRMVWRLAGAGLLAFGVFVASWPWLYPAPFERMWDYILFITVDHWQIGQFYLHKFYLPPPWHFPFVMVLAVVPLMFLLVFIAGAVRTWREKEHSSLGVMIALNAVVPLLVLATGKSMVYDNERLFMPAFPFIAALGAVGVGYLIQQLEIWLTKIQRTKLAQPLAVGLVILVFLPHLTLAAPLYPHWLSYYSESVGSLPGATKLGLETTYWCETYTEALGYINENAEAGDIVWVDPWSYDVMVYYQLHGRLRDDVLITAPQGSVSGLTVYAPLTAVSYEQADFIVVQHRQTSYRPGGAAYPITGWLFNRTPVLEYRYLDIPLVSVYQRGR